MPFAVESPWDPPLLDANRCIQEHGRLRDLGRLIEDQEEHHEVPG